MSRNPSTYAFLYADNRCSYQNCGEAVVQYALYEHKTIRESNKVIRLCRRHQYDNLQDDRALRIVTIKEVADLQNDGEHGLALAEAKRDGYLSVHKSGDSVVGFWRSMCRQAKAPFILHYPSSHVAFDAECFETSSNWKLAKQMLNDLLIQLEKLGTTRTRGWQTRSDEIISYHGTQQGEEALALIVQTCNVVTNPDLMLVSFVLTE